MTGGTCWPPVSSKVEIVVYNRYSGRAPLPEMPSLKSSGHEAELGGFPLRNLLGCWLTDGLLDDCLLGGRFFSLRRCCFSHGDSLPLESESARTNKTCAISSNLLTTKVEYGCEICRNTQLCGVIVAFFMFLNGLFPFFRAELKLLI